MKIDLKGIIEGVKNKYFPAKELKEYIASVSTERMGICKDCAYYSPNAGYDGPRPDVHCINCGCNLEFKGKCLSCSCPQGKWDAKISRGEEEQLIKRINEQQTNNP